MRTRNAAGSLRAAARVAACSGLLFTACSAKVRYQDVPSPPLTLSYRIEFNTQANAVWLDDLVISIVGLEEEKYPDDASRAAACRELLVRRRTGQSFDPDYEIVAQSPEVTPCELADSDEAGRYEVPFGPKAIVVVGRNRQTPGVTDVQIGCGWGEAADGAAPIRIVLEPFSQFVPTPPPAPSDCARLADKCKNGGRCP